MLCRNDATRFSFLQTRDPDRLPSDRPRDPRPPEILHSAITQGSGSNRGTESLTTAIEDQHTQSKERPQMESCT